jgi:hypothetical protein
VNLFWAASVIGVATTFGLDEAVVLLFEPSRNLLWQRALSAGTSAQEAAAVATAPGGLAYFVGSIIDFASGTPTRMSLTKIAPDGTIVWQKAWTTASGMAVAVAPEGSVYAAGQAPVPGAPANDDLVALKLAHRSSLVWARTYAAGSLADARGGATAGPDGSLYLAGAIQGLNNGLAALIVKLNPDGTLAFDRAWGTAATAAGVSLAADGTLFVSGTVGSGIAFVIHLQASGKVTDANTWAAASSTGCTNGGGVGVAGDRAIRGAGTATSPPLRLRLRIPDLLDGQGHAHRSDRNLRRCHRHHQRSRPGHHHPQRDRHLRRPRLRSAHQHRPLTRTEPACRCAGRPATT